ncbi:MAG: hypothetical protein A2V70_02555 [Planctomycetes bacterium RBG_13_63_9]|nr:MAG: hypothetical protein A2V70_02555 [Planctomycetes bacterium RBG_13_63_9]
MNGRSRPWSVTLAIALAVAAFSLMPSDAVARDDFPACKLPGPHCIWHLFDWLWSSGGMGNDSSDSGDGDGGGGEEDEGEQEFDKHYGPW